VHVSGRHQRNARLPGDFLQSLQLPSIVRPTVQFGQQITTIAEQVAERGERGERRGERGKCLLTVRKTTS